MLMDTDVRGRSGRLGEAGEKSRGALRTKSTVVNVRKIISFLGPLMVLTNKNAFRAPGNILLVSTCDALRKAQPATLAHLRATALT
jgi:hypothetical protein